MFVKYKNDYFYVKFFAIKMSFFFLLKKVIFYKQGIYVVIKKNNQKSGK